MATDAAYAPDGSSFVIRTYFSATVYSAPGEQLSKVTMPPLEQAESIAYTADGTALLTGTEGTGSPVYRVPLPERVLEAMAPTPTPTPTSEPGAGTETGREAAGAVRRPRTPRRMRGSRSRPSPSGWPWRSEPPAPSPSSPAGPADPQSPAESAGPPGACRIH
nr:hypothetical protein GCM10020093_066130 [Planobispora longispora]